MTITILNYPDYPKRILHVAHTQNESFSEGETKIFDNLDFEEFQRYFVLVHSPSNDTDYNIKICRRDFHNNVIGNKETILSVSNSEISGYTEPSFVPAQAIDVIVENLNTQDIEVDICIAGMV